MLHKRIFGLDILRAIAVLLVLLAHTITAIGLTKVTVTIAIISAIIGVELFFVLSGFLIGTILLKMHNQDSITNFLSIKIFWIRRWFRTLPNYYLAIIGYAFLYYLGTKEIIFDSLYGLSFLVFLQNFFTFEFTNVFFAVSWSLVVEEWFYLLFPVFLYCSQFFFNKKKSFLVVIILFLSIPLIIKMFFACYNTGIPWDAGYRKIAPIRLDAIGFGVLVAFVKFYYKDFFENYKKIFLLFGTLLFCFLMIVFYKLFIPSYDFAAERQLSNPGFFMNTMFFTLISLSISLLIPSLNNIKINQSINQSISKLINIISLSSYSIYLFHPFYIFLFQYIYSKLNIQIDVYWVLLVWLTSIIASYFQYILFEVKMTGLRDKFGNKKDKITV